MSWYTTAEVAEQIGVPLADVETLAGQMNDVADLYDPDTEKVSTAGLELIREHLAPEIKTWGTEAIGYTCTLVWQHSDHLRHSCRSHTPDDEHLCPCGAALKISRERLA